MQQREDKKFSVVKRAKSFAHASRGIWILFKTTHNAWIHLVVLAVAIMLGFIFNISAVD